MRVKSAERVSASRGRQERPNPYDEGKSSRTASLEAALVVTSSMSLIVPHESRRDLSRLTSAVNGVL